MPVRTFIEAIRDGMAEEMRRDETVVVLGEDVGKKGGVFLATDGLWGEFGDDRVIDTPLTESMIVGASIGAAINGLRPVAEIQFADFIHPAFNQLVSEAARMRYRSNNGFSVPMVVRAPYGGGVHGALYHSQSVEAFFTHVPGLKVVIPSTPYDAKGLLRTAIRDDDPVLFFEHKKMYRSVRGEVPDGDYSVPLGSAAIRRTGSQVTVIGYGLMTLYALEAAERVAEEGIDVEVVDIRSLRPLDRDTILSSVRKTGQVPRGLRGQPVRRLRRGDLRDRRRGGVRLPRRAGEPDRRPRRPGRAVQPRARGLVHAQPGEDRRRDPEARRVLMAPAPDLVALEARLQRVLDPYRDRLEPATIYNLPTLRRPGAKAHDWFAFVKPASKHVSFFLMPIVTWPDLLDGCSDALAPTASGEVGVHLRDAGRGPYRRARVAGGAGVRAVRGRGLDGSPIATSGSAPRNTPIRAASSSMADRSAFVSRRHGATRIASRPFLTSWVHVAVTAPPTITTWLIQPAVLDTSGRRASGSSGSASFWSGQRVGVEARQQADGGRRVDVGELGDVVAPDQHLRAIGQDLDHAVAQRRDRLAQRRAALDAPPARELAFGAARERGQLALDDGADRVLAGLGHLATQPGARVDEGHVPAVVGAEAQEAAAGGGLQERAPARGHAVGERLVAELLRQGLAEGGAGHRRVGQHVADPVLEGEHLLPGDLEVPEPQRAAAS